MSVKSFGRFFFNSLSIIILPFYFPPNEDNLTLDILVSAFYADVWGYKEFEGIRESYTNEMPNTDKYKRQCFAFCLLIYCLQRQVKVVFCYGFITLTPWYQNVKYCKEMFMCEEDVNYNKSLCFHSSTGPFSFHAELLSNLFMTFNCF